MTQEPDAPAADERLTLGQEIIAWIETTCRVPEGALIGQPIQLMEWQKSWILRVYNNPAGTRRAILSLPRKSGKTCLSATLLLAHLVGPAAIPNSQLYSAAQSRDQAALLYGLAARIIRMSPTLSAKIVCKDGTKQLVCPSRGTVYRASRDRLRPLAGLSSSRRAGRRSWSAQRTLRSLRDQHLCSACAVVDHHQHAGAYRWRFAFDSD